MDFKKKELEFIEQNEKLELKTKELLEKVDEVMVNTFVSNFLFDSKNI